VNRHEVDEVEKKRKEKERNGEGYGENGENEDDDHVRQHNKQAEERASPYEENWYS